MSYIQFTIVLILAMLHSLTFADGTTSRNVLGEAQSPFVGSHITGFYRDGYCHTDENDPGQHAIAATMTSQFLEFTKSQGNDLQTPMPQYHFAGLKPGDHWCICTSRWKEAEEAGVAPPVDLKATHAAALSLVPLKTLKKYQAHLPLLQSRP